MPNTNKNTSSDQANQIYSSVGPAVQPSIDTANQQQQKQITNSDQTLGTAQDQGKTAQSTIESTNPTYSDFMKTGGFSPSDETTYLNRATQGVSGTYDVLGQAAERQRAAAGGLGTSGEFSQIARQGTQAQASATENAQADLKQQENSNKLAGASGEVSAGNALTSLYGQTNQLYDQQTNQITAQGAQVLQALGLKYSTQEEAAGILQKLSSEPGTYAKIIQMITALKPGYSSSGGASVGG